MKSIEYRSNKQLLGFTLIELMVVLVIVAILAMVAVPSFNSATRRNSVESIQSVIGSAVATARTEAASRNKFVTICAIDITQNTEECLDGTGGTWADGWVVFEDDNNDQIVDDDETVIDVYQHYSDGFTISLGKNAGDTDFITFNPQGFVQGTQNSFFKVCDAQNDTFTARGVYVNSSGLVIKSRDLDTDTDVIHNNPLLNNDNIVCP